ncbi:MAG TPA: fibronectin type III domain-containing protein [Pyrinomonadaceae bacterium]|nr:fibronectin type III domain-containing protein [Pyrinomonadaceae bacterium]
MTTRRLSRLVNLLAILAVFVVFVLVGSTTSAQRGDKTPPTKPTNLRVTSITETTVTLVWNPASDNSGKFTYKLKINNQQNSAYNSLATISQTQTTYTAKFLATNSPYSFSVYAVDASNNRSADSNTATAKTLADVTGPPVPFLEAVTIAPSQVRLTWTKSTDNVANNCCSYGINVNGTPTTQFINWVSSGSADKLAAVVRHLKPGTAYSFSISVSDWSAGNNTSMSNTAFVTTQPSSDTTPPAAPTNLRLVLDQSCGEIFLGWNQTTDNVDSQDKIEYEIFVNGVVSPLPVSAGIDQDFVYATAHGENAFFVRAVDRSGNSSAPSQSIKLFLWPC